MNDRIPVAAIFFYEEADDGFSFEFEYAEAAEESICSSAQLAFGAVVTILRDPELLDAAAENFVQSALLQSSEDAETAAE